MRQWLLIRRLRGPAFLLLIGFMAVLHEWTSFGFGRSWPLILILAGLFSLAERAALAQPDYDGAGPLTGSPFSGQQPDPTGYTGSSYTGSGTSIVPAPPPHGPESGAGRP